MKKFLGLTLFLSLFIFTSFAADFSEIAKLESSVSEGAMENIVKANPGFSFYDTAESIKAGTYEADLKGILSKGISMLFSEVRANIKIMGAVMLIGILSSFVSNLSASFGKGGVTEASFLCCYALLSGVAATGFYEISECAKSAVNEMGLFMKSLIPLLSFLSASEGRVITASVLHTQILTSVAVNSFVTERVILPLLYTTFALKFINNITVNLSLSNLSKMADKLMRRILSFTLLIFTAVLSLSGFATGTVENMGLKTARFALGTFVPVAGGALADSVSAITASAKMIKNSVGLTGVIAVVLIAAYPVIKCAAVSFIYNFTGALLELVCDTRLSKAVTSVGEAMGMLFGIVAITAAECIISTSILLFVYVG